jgi:hypothetical protein
MAVITPGGASGRLKLLDREVAEMRYTTCEVRLQRAQVSILRLALPDNADTHVLNYEL